MLENQVVAIAGASGRLGKAFTRSIIANKGKVLLADVTELNDKQLESLLTADTARFTPTDCTDSRQIDDFLETGVRAFGKIDAAVYCAYPRSGQWGTRFEDLKADLLNEDLSKQLGGAILFSQRIIKYFQRVGRGNLIHISSIQGISAPKFEHYENTRMVSPIEYSAIKAGIISITKYLAKYCKNGNIRVNCISPGGILENQPEIFLEKYRSSCLNKGMLDPEDITGSLLYLLSDQSRYVNGQNIVVDDGWSL